MLAEPLFGLLDCLAFFFGFRLIVEGRRSQLAGNGIEDGFEEPDDGVDLARRQTLDQFVGLPFFIRGIVSNEMILPESPQSGATPAASPILRSKDHPLGGDPRPSMAGIEAEKELNPGESQGALFDEEEIFLCRVNHGNGNAA